MVDFQEVKNVPGVYSAELRAKDWVLVLVRIPDSPTLDIYVYQTIEGSKVCAAATLEKAQVAELLKILASE